MVNLKRCIICQNHINEVIDLLNLFSRQSTTCEQCANQLTFNHEARRCKKCLKIMSEEEVTCLDCQWLSNKYPLINQLYTLYDYDGLVKALIQQYKLNGMLHSIKYFNYHRNYLSIMITLFRHPFILISCNKEHSIM